MFELQYIRTDRNGTKIYHDWTCSRCGGAGRSDKWWKSGYTCYECGGTGKRRVPKEVKEYTPEYAAKLEARRIARLEKQPKPDEADLKAAFEESKRTRWQEQGFTADGVGFIHAGDTYKHKDAIRRAGGKWCSYISAWIAPKQLELQGVRITEINAQDVCNEYNCIDPEKMWDLQDSI